MTTKTQIFVLREFILTADWRKVRIPIITLTSASIAAVVARIPRVLLFTGQILNKEYELANAFTSLFFEKP
jgi:hypothetical protein